MFMEANKERKLRAIRERSDMREERFIY